MNRIAFNLFLVVWCWARLCHYLLQMWGA